MIYLKLNCVNSFLSISVSRNDLQGNAFRISFIIHIFLKYINYIQAEIYWKIMLQHLYSINVILRAPERSGCSVVVCCWKSQGIDWLNVGPAALLSAVCSWRLVMLLLLLSQMVNKVRSVVTCKLTYQSLHLRCSYLLYLCACHHYLLCRINHSLGRHFEHFKSDVEMFWLSLNDFFLAIILISSVNSKADRTKWNYNVVVT